MPRVAVIGRIAAILDAPIANGPASYTYRDLACEVYATDDPTAAQLSAVRRAVAQLVAEGLAERTGRGSGSGTGAHVRQRGGRTMTYKNPTGVMVRRSEGGEPMKLQELDAAVAEHVATTHFLDEEGNEYAPDDTAPPEVDDPEGDEDAGEPRREQRAANRERTT